MAFQVVPQWIVEVLAPALATDLNVGRVLAEQIARAEPTGTILARIAGEAPGKAVGVTDRVALPPIVNNRAWQDVADDLRRAAATQ